jgi:ribonuclease P protein component
MSTYETDIPTQQTTPQKNYRLSSPHENPRRPQGYQSTPQSRPEETSRLIFSKEMRLRSRREFQRMTREGKRLVGRFLCIDCRPAAGAKLGISASARYGSSPERNRFKRLIREAFRQSYASLPPFELHVIPRQCAKKARCSDIADELARLLK